MGRGTALRRCLGLFAISWLTLVGGLLWWSTAPALVGLQPRLVTSGSMEPALHAGDIVVTAKTDTSTIKPGHVVVVSDPSKPGDTYVHRLIRRDPDGRLVTQGDANRTADYPPIEQSRVLAEVRFAVPMIGLPALWLHRHQIPQGLFVGLTLSVVLALLLGGPRAMTALLASLALLIPLALGGLASAGFSAQTANDGSSLTTAVLNNWLPSAVTTVRISATTCSVAWTANAAAPGALTYDVTDGTGITVATAVSGTTIIVTVGAADATPTVLARYGTWTSSSQTAAAAACAGYPQPPTVTLTPTDGQLIATWPAPTPIVSAIIGYTATISPGSGSCSLLPIVRTCTFAGLTNGTEYTVSVTATNLLGTSAPGTATGFSYPSTVMTSGSTALWLDGADRSTLFASSGCTGAAAVGTIGCWQDKSVNANHGSQPTGIGQPTVSVLNGLSSPSFDGVDDFMNLSVASLPTGTTPSTIYVVAVQEDPTPTSSNHRGVLAWGTSAAGAARVVTKGFHSTLAYLDTWTSSGVPIRSWATGSATFVDGEITSTSTTARVNSVQSYTVSESHNTGTGGAWLGAEIGGNWGQWQGRIAEVIVLSSTVTSAQNRRVEDYLALKWGTPITPQAPSSVTGVAGNSSATVSWSAPAWNGGAAVTSYTVTATPSGQTCTAVAPVTTCIVTGLVNATTYTFTVTATNSVGVGPSSLASAGVTPVAPFTVPGAPTSPAAAPGDTTALVSWTTPASDGGTAISSYTATGTPSDAALATVTCSAATTGCTASGLVDGATYSFTVTATNIVGTSSASTSTSTIPFPALLTSSNSQIWLDGYDVDGNGVSTGAAENCDTATTCAALANVVKRWVDKSGRGHDAVQATTALAPAYAAASHTVSFNANGYSRASGVGTGPDSTVFAVASSPVTPFNTHGWLMGSRSINGYLLHPGSGSSGVWWFGIRNTVYNDQTPNAGSVAPTTTITNPHIWDGWISGSGPTSANMGIDGNVGTTKVDAAARIATSLTITIGADDFDLVNRRGKGNYREVTAFDRALSTSERRIMQEYLARKWGVPITPAAPVGASAVPGLSTAVVSWTAPTWDGGAALATYVVTPSGAGTCSWISGTTVTCTGLTHLASYTFTVKATNSVGSGPIVTTSAITP